MPKMPSNENIHTHTHIYSEGEFQTHFEAIDLTVEISVKTSDCCAKKK